MDGERSDGEPEVADEFACAGMLRGSLASLHGTVERIFSVRFSIGADDISGSSNGQIWLKLQGQSNDVKAAKLYVKGVVNQEEQQEVSYPRVLHCVFCGAKGLFMDCLIKNTSAQIVIGSPGFLLISGLAEPVVRAYSLITDLVERCEDTQARRTDTGDRGGGGFGESVDSRRTFKTLVEKWEDRHTLDLLVLPGTVKEILLDLVTDSGLGGSSHIPALVDGNAGARLHSDSEGRWDSSTDRWVEGTTTANSLKDSTANHSFSRSFSSSDGGRGSAEGAEVRLMHSPQEVGEEEQQQPEKGAGLVTEVTEGQGQEREREQELQLSLGNKEFLLLKFFTAMGYTEDVVKRVIARTGPKEASQILDFVQQEQDRSDRRQNQEDGGAREDASNRSERNRPCETEHREDDKAMDESKNNGEVGGVSRQCEGASGGTGGVEAMVVAAAAAGQEEDFVLGVLKKAAVSCGYMEQNVAKVYSMLPDRSTHQLILELQREESKELEAERRKEGPREMDDVVLEKEKEKEKEKERPKAEAIRDTGLFKPAEKRESVDKGWAEVNLSLNDKPPANHHTAKPIRQQPSKLQSPHQINLPVVKGPPVSTYPTTALDVPMNFQSNSQFDRTIFWPDPSTSKKQNQSNQDNVLNLVAPQTNSNNALKRALQGPQLPFFSGNDLSPTRARERRGFAATPSVVVTGEQRFLEGLQAPFELQLMDKPGDPKLRAVIIDGSNVAMSHGLGNFFSCRGIALAVQHFWDRGHRHISALLPQWRQKNDPRIKERHYLSALQNVGLVSYTPSREVEGKRISSYDDRFMLQHAQKTNGVIVTNDNLRDLSDESAVWRDIIKKRLLQYTFVGDHFMVPDDPLGRGGPHLDDFLRSDHRTPDPGNHTFAGLPSNFPPSQPPPRSQTEVLNFRDRTLGGALDGTHSRGGGGQGRGRGAGHGKGWGAGQRLGGTATDRSPHETAILRERLCQVFVGQDNMVALVLQCHSAETDVNVLSDLILEQQKD